MANFKNTVPRKYGNEYEFPARCKHCAEVPKQGWSFMGSFIWCENDECNNRLHSEVATTNQLGQWWDMVQAGKCSPSTFPKQLWDDVELPVCRSCCGTGKAWNAGSDSHGRCRECKGSGESNG